MVDGPPKLEPKDLKMIRFFYNGIKTSADKKLQKAFYYEHDNGNICVTCESYAGFSSEIEKLFAVIDNTDIMTDHFEKSRFIISPNDQYYVTAKKALLQGKLKYFIRQLIKCQKRNLASQAAEWQTKIDECVNTLKGLN